MKAFGAIFVCGLALLMSMHAQATAVKADPKAAKGCIPKVSLDDAKDALSRFNLRTEHATTDEIRTLGTGLTWIEKLNGGKPLEDAVGKGKEGYSFKFMNATGNSQQLAGGVIIRRNGGKEYGENVAQLVHELGHFVGNNGVYEQYREAMKGSFCVVSSYSDDKFNEQFAETFAAFVTRPDLIHDNDSKGCERAYRFFSKVLFEDGELATECESGK